MAYLSGNILKFIVQFNDSASDALVDPTAVTFKYQINGGAFSSTYTYSGASTPAVGTLARDSIGLYEIWIDSTGFNGVVTGLWVSTGSHAASAQDIITVGQSIATGNTFFDLIEKVYRRLMSGEREIAVQNDAAMGSADTSVKFDGPQNIAIFPGCRIAIEMEDVFVTAYNTGTQVATVVRGYDGSEPSAHPTGVVCYVNPKFTRFDIGVAINDDLRSMSSPDNGLYRVNTVQLTWNPVFMGYDLSAVPNNFLDILAVSYREVDPARRFPVITNDEWGLRRFGQQTTDASFPSGQAIILYREAYPGLPVYVTYSAPFIKLVSPSDSILNTPTVNDESPPYGGYGSAVTLPNLEPTMVDIPCLGAEIDLNQVREVSRNFMDSQPDPRKAQDVPAQAVATATNPLVLRRDKRISEEAMRLYLRYPNQRR